MLVKLSEVYRNYLDTIECFSAVEWDRITREAESHTAGEDALFAPEDNSEQTQYTLFLNAYDATNASIQVVSLFKTKQANEGINYSVYSGEGEVA